MSDISLAYCEDCLKLGLEPYNIMVAYISGAGRFPEDIGEKFQEHIRRNLRMLGKTEEQFIKDVDKANDEFDEFI